MHLVQEMTSVYCTIKNSALSGTKCSGLKDGGKDTEHIYTLLENYTINFCYITQQWPQDGKRSVFIPIPKKGNAKECSNYTQLHSAHTLVK